MLHMVPHEEGHGRGSEFIACSVPLAFEGRFFVLKPGNPVVVTVVKSYVRQLIFEIKDNDPVINMLSDVIKAANGTITVVDKTSGKLIYKVCPGIKTSVILSKNDGGEITAVITDKQIKIGGLKLENRAFIGGGSVVTVGSNGSVGIGSPIPLFLLQWFKK